MSKPRVKAIIKTFVNSTCLLQNANVIDSSIKSIEKSNWNGYY